VKKQKKEEAIEFFPLPSSLSLFLSSLLQPRVFLANHINRSLSMLLRAKASSSLAKSEMNKMFFFSTLSLLSRFVQKEKTRPSNCSLFPALQRRCFLFLFSSMERRRCEFEIEMPAPGLGAPPAALESHQPRREAVVLLSA
jgi:hypothetical protein